jgi:hypothetical protein
MKDGCRNRRRTHSCLQRRELGNDPLSRIHKLRLLLSDPSSQQLAVSLLYFAGDHDRIDIRRTRLHHNAIDHLMSRHQVEVGRAEHDEIRLLSGRQ